MYVYLFIYVYMCIYKCIYMYPYMYACMYVCTHTYIYVYIYMYILRICKYIHTNIYVYIYIYIYTYIKRLCYDAREESEISSDFSCVQIDVRVHINICLYTYRTIPNKHLYMKQRTILVFRIYIYIYIYQHMYTGICGKSMHVSTHVYIYMWKIYALSKVPTVRRSS